MTWQKRRDQVRSTRDSLSHVVGGLAVPDRPPDYWSESDGKFREEMKDFEKDLPPEQRRIK